MHLIGFIAAASMLALSHSFGASKPIRMGILSRNSMKMHFEEALVGNTALADGALQRERYIASNRFNVKENQGAKFEKRWAERKSRLAQLPGFRFFALLKRVEAYGAQYDDEGNFGNYISYTIWKNKDNFDEWRTG